MNNYVVYQHRNKTNGKIYVGITSQPPHKRWCNGSTYTNNTHFYRAIQKYGWSGFEHTILYENLDKESACKIEKTLIEVLHLTDPEKGYNKAKGGEGGGMFGKHHSEDAKKKISKARKQNGFSEEHRRHISESKSGAKHHRAKKVYQYTKDLRFVKEWEYLSGATKELGIHKSSITACCKGKRPSAGGYIWRYEKIVEG